MRACSSGNYTTLSRPNYSRPGANARKYADVSTTQMTLRGGKWWNYGTSKSSLSRPMIGGLSWEVENYIYGPLVNTLEQNDIQ